MANPYFKFKKFTVFHDRCAMKVGTDGVLLGAWTRIGLAKKILDVGTGSGLISLMLSQRSNQQLLIDAIDIDEDAVCQAKNNIEKSGFGNISCQHISLQDYNDSCSIKYDLIVSNPPYFSLSLVSANKQRTLARHAASLKLDDFIRISSRLLSDEGRLSIVFPYSNKDLLVSLSKKYGLFISRTTNVYSTPTSEPKRILFEFSISEMPIVEEDLVIEEERHKYSSKFKALVNDFYLNP